MEERACSYQTGMASEFLVMSMLFRLGLNPQLTLGNNKRVDIFVPKEEEGEFITIDVKSVRAFNSIPVGNVKARKNHFVVVVIYKNKFEDVSFFPDFYVIPSGEVVAKAKIFPTGPTDLFRKYIEEFKDKWELLK